MTLGAPKGQSSGTQALAATLLWWGVATPAGGFRGQPTRSPPRPQTGRDLTLSLQQYFFWRASDRDAIYGTSGAVFRPGTGTRASYVGAEMDLLATYDFTRHLQVYAGYSHFWAGEFIRNTGPSRDGDFLYAAIQYTF